MAETKVYVLEGADATGKSTLAMEMQSRADLDDPAQEYVYIHNDASDAKLPGSLYRHYRAQLLDALDRPNTITIIDRSWLSEYVYGTLYRGAPRITGRQVAKLTRWAKKHGIVLLGLYADPEVRFRRIRERGETWDVTQRAVGESYAQIFQDLSWTTVDSTSTLRP